MAHLGPEEIGRVWAPGTAVNARLATQAEKNLENLYRLRRRAGADMDRLTTPPDPTRPGKKISPLLTGAGGDDMARYLGQEAADAPVVLDAILEAADMVHSVGRGAGYTSTQANALRKAMQADGASPEEINAAIAREIQDAPWTIESMAKMREAVGNVVNRMFERGGQGTTVAKRLAEFNEGVMERLGAYGEAGPQLQRAIQQYRQAGNVMETLMQYTGAQRVARASGEKNWVVPRHTPQPSPISTPAARFVGDAIVPTGGAAVSSAGLTAGLIAAQREGPAYLRRGAVGEGARQMLRTGERGSDLLRSLERNTRPGRTATPMPTSSLLGARAAGAYPAQLIPGANVPSGGGLPGLLGAMRPQLTEEEKQKLGWLDPRRFQ